MSRDDVTRSLRDARLAVYRKALVDAAEAVFAEHGVEAATMKQIAARAGISIGVMYDVFEGKEALLEAVHRTRGEELLERAAAVLGAGTPLDVLLAGVEVMVRYFEEHPDYLRLQLRDGVAWSHPELAPGLDRTTWQGGLEMMASMLEAGRADGSLVDEDPMQSARLLVALHQTCLADFVLADPRPAAEEVIGRLSRLVRRNFVRVDPPEPEPARARTPRRRQASRS